MNYYLRKFRKIIYKIPQTMLNWLTCVAAFLALMARFGIDKLKEFQVGGIGDYAETIDNFFSEGVHCFDQPVAKVCIYVVFGVMVCLLACKRFIHPKAFVFKHSTFSGALSSCDETVFSGYTVREVDVDLVHLMNNQEIMKAIQCQDEYVKKIKRNCDEYTELFYYGIAHIPLIFRAGFQFGDEGQTRLLHKYRNGTTQFKEISAEQDDFSVTFRNRRKKYNNDSREMLLVIATSFQVSSQDLRIFREKHMRCELLCEITEEAQYGFDAIESYSQMDRLKSQVLKEMRSMVAEYNIERVHLVLSTSSDFVFYLAESFSAYHDPEIIVYQYERTSEEKYPWGISNKATPANAIIFQSFSETT